MKKFNRNLLIGLIVLAVVEGGLYIIQTNSLKNTNEKLLVVEDEIQKSKEEMNILNKKLESVPDVDALTETEKSKLLKNNGNREDVIEEYRLYVKEIKVDIEQEKLKEEQLKKEYDELSSNTQKNFTKAAIKLNSVVIILFLCFVFFRKREKQETDI